MNRNGTTEQILIVGACGSFCGPGGLRRSRYETASRPARQELGWGLRSPPSSIGRIGFRPTAPAGKRRDYHSYESPPASGELIEVADGIYWIRMLPFKF